MTAVRAAFPGKKLVVLAEKVMGFPGGFCLIMPNAQNRLNRWQIVVNFNEKLKNI